MSLLSGVNPAPHTQTLDPTASSIACSAIGKNGAEPIRNDPSQQTKDVGKSNLKSKCQWMLADQNAGLCQLLTAPVPMALAVIEIVSALDPPSMA